MAKKYRMTKEKEHNLEFYRTHRKELQKLIRTANRRWRDLEERGLPSRAIDEALGIRKRKYFRSSDFQTKNGLVNLQRLRNFLADPTSNIRGAEYYKDTVVDVEEFRRLYGTSWQEDPETGIRVNNYNERFSAKYGEDFTKRVYANYRRIEKDHQMLLAQGILPEAFDSDTLITLMFDSAIDDPSYYGDDIETGLHSEEVNAPEFKRAKKVLNYYEQRVDKSSKRYNDLAQKAHMLYSVSAGWFDSFKGGVYDSW